VRRCGIPQRLFQREKTTVLDALVEVYLEQLNRSPSDLRFADENDLIPFEVIFPYVRPGIEEGYEPLRHRIVCCYVASFEIIASRAGPTEIQEPWNRGAFAIGCGPLRAAMKCQPEAFCNTRTDCRPAVALDREVRGSSGSRTRGLQRQSGLGLHQV